MTQLGMFSAGWLWIPAVLVGAVVAALAAHALVFALAARLVKLTPNAFDESIVHRGRAPMRVIFPLGAILLALPESRIPEALVEPIRHAVGIGLIISAAWLLVALIGVADDLVEAKYRIDVKDNLAARRVRTQIAVLRRIAVVVVSIVTAGIVLMTFPSIRHIGDSLLASAGLAGLIVGLAARPALSNLIAGVQLAMTEPIRVDDVVIVEGEWGWIEEIRTTYVVVRIWDLRRLVVPLSYFIEKPFQNWTRKTADLLGTVFIYADYSLPVEEVRRELRRILESSGKWDGKVCVLEVTNASEHTVELRALVSAPDSSTAWDLRCYVREKLIEFLRERHPECLPRTRAEIYPLSQGKPAADVSPR
jgi:small-conductance mechanosensitive channel